MNFTARVHWNESNCPSLRWVQKKHTHIALHILPPISFFKSIRKGGGDEKVFFCFFFFAAANPISTVSRYGLISRFTRSQPRLHLMNWDQLPRFQHLLPPNLVGTPSSVSVRLRFSGRNVCNALIIVLPTLLHQSEIRYTEWIVGGGMSWRSRKESVDFVPRGGK